MSVSDPVAGDSAAAARAAIPGWASRLRQRAAQIDAAFSPLEPVFLTTGERLRSLHGQVSRLSAAAECAGARLSSAEMTGMLAGLAAAAGQIDLMRRQRGGLGETLGRIISGTDGMLRALAALSGIMAQVRVLAINAKIEASYLVSTGIDFTVFTREIARLAGSGQETIAGVHQELSGLRAAAMLARDLQRSFEERDLPELDTVAAQLAVAIDGLRAFQERAADGAREIPGRLGALFGHITALVSNMQIYDTTRQRLEHVSQALVLAADMIEARDASGMDGAQVRVFVNGIAELQALQLGHASDHYHEAVTGVGRSLAAMAEGAPPVGSLCARVFGGDGSVQDIDRHLGRAGEICHAFTAVREKAARSLGQVVEAATRAGTLMRSLNSVNGDMRLMGLNAAIKCGNMGMPGRSLSVVAQELQGCAGLTRSHVEQVAASLQAITGAAQDIALADDRDTGTVDAGAVTRDLETGVGRLHETGEQLTALLQEIESLSASVVALTGVADQGFSGKADCRRALTAEADALKALAADSDPGLRGGALEAARREVLAFTESHYTMASERSVHGRAVDGHAVVSLLTGAADAAAEAAAGPAAAADIDSLLF
ncbi:MAG: hypothetical protein WCO00_02060 [Rhodospirillaceae bacterium]